jgi:Rab5 GDP/GTP exchange factor
MIPTSDPSVLKEFDPLASDPVEKNAREAWENAEGHPPPLPPSTKDSSNSRSTSPVLPTFPFSAAPQKEEEVSGPLSQKSVQQAPLPAPATSSTFPSLASLARTLTRSPRRSVTPPPPPPPRTSSLHHTHPSLSSMPSNLVASASLPNASLESQAASARVEERSSPHMASSSDDVRVATPPKPDGQFDFQKFLDQMKTKGADPIAKYLRRWVAFKTACQRKILTQRIILQLSF